MTARRILYVQHYSGWGGSLISLLALIERLDRARYEPTVLFNSPVGPALERYRAAGVRVMHDPAIGTFAHAQGAWMPFRSLRPWLAVAAALKIRSSARRFEEILRQERFDIVHLNSAVQVPAAIGAACAGVPVVWHVREELHPGYFGLRRAFVRRVIRRCASAVVAISKQNAAQLCYAGPLRVVYNFVDLGRFSPSVRGDGVRRELGVGPDQPVVLMLGGVVESKGADVFVEAAALLAGSHPDAAFIIAGPGPQGESPSAARRVLRRAVERLLKLPNVERRAVESIRRHGLQPRVRFIGMRDDIPELLAAATLVVWPAAVSHFARPIIEAGAVGRPVVASDLPSARELVIDGVTGLLFPPTSPAALAERIRRVIDNPAAAAQMGRAGRKLAVERYDAARNAAVTMQVYPELLEATA